MARMTLMKTVGIAGVCIMSTLAASEAARAARTLNRGIHAVPAPPRVVIDGDLSEWDTSGEIVCCKNVDSLLEVESARVSAMWDEENLYVGIVWRDDMPMQNKVDPVTMPGNGWRSDCVQFRCNMDGFISHIDCWYYTTGKKSAMAIAYVDLSQRDKTPHTTDRPASPFELGAQQVFRLSEDGGGYVQEIRIPWKVITKDQKRPRDGTDLRLGVELFWGDLSADSWPKGRITDNLYEGFTETDFFWTNTKAWGSLVLEKENDIRLPTPPWMRAARTEPTGPVPVEFRLDQESYVTIALEDEDGNRVKSLVGGVKYPAGRNTVRWSGLDDRNELLPPGRYNWVGLKRNEINAVWKMSFYQPNVRSPWKTSDGTGAWGPDHGNIMAAAAGGGMVFTGGLGAEAGIPLFAAREDGTKAWSAQSGEPDKLAYADGIVYGYTSRGDSNWLGITPRGIMRFDAAKGTWLDIPGRDGKPTRRLPLLADGEEAVDMTADASGVYLAVKDRPLIRKYDRETFQLEREYEVVGARLLHSVGERLMLVATVDELIALDPTSSATRILLRAGLSDATDLTANARGDVAYIALGAPHHTVHVYSVGPGSARMVRRIGMYGGRTTNGPYDPNEGFRNPCALAVDSTDRLWVVEHDQRPKRVSVWSGGEWVRDFIGDTGYGGGGVINPLDPTEAFYRDMTFRIDIETGQWQLTRVGFVMPEGAEAIGLASGAGDHATGEDVEAEYIMAHGSRAYIHKCRGSRHIYRKLDDGRWTLCAFIDPGRKIAWTDANDDCAVQESEIVRGGESDDWGGTDYWGMRPSKNLDLFFSRGVGRPGLRLRPTGFTPGGTPLYDLGRFEEMAGECMNGVGLADGSYNSGCAGDRGEYFSEMRAIKEKGAGGRTFWFRGENTGRWTARLPEPGLVLYPFQAHGIADLPDGGEVMCWVSDFGQRYLFTEDMLYVDELFTDSRVCRVAWPDVPEPGFVADEMSPGQESFHGFFTRLADGRYIITNGFTDCRVFELTGVGSIRRMRGSAVIEPEHEARSREIQAFRRGGGAARGEIAIARVEDATKPDGILKEYNRDNAVRMKVDAARGAEVIAVYDESNLYVAWEVKDATPMRNSSQDWRLAFKGGDAVDLMYRAPGADLDDAKVRAGDVRVLIAEIGGAPTAVLYKQISETKQPHLFDAFEGAGRGNAVAMDEVRIATEVTAVIRKADGGYVVEASIPWLLLGGAPPAGAEARIDFGVLYSDPSGARTMLRSYWENADTNIVSDIPSEAALSPGNWGIASFGK
jgi:hypothetical protein